MTNVKLYEGRPFRSELRTYDVRLREQPEEGFHRVVTLEGDAYYVSKPFYERVKKGLRDGVDPVIIDIKGTPRRLVTSGQKGSYISIPDEEPFKQKKKEKVSVSDMVDSG